MCFGSPGSLQCDLDISLLSWHAPPTYVVLGVPRDLIFCQCQEKPSLFHPRAITLIISCLKHSFNSCSLPLTFEVSMQILPPTLRRSLKDFYHTARFYFPLHLTYHKYFHYFFIYFIRYSWCSRDLCFCLPSWAPERTALPGSLWLSNVM